MSTYIDPPVAVIAADVLLAAVPVDKRDELFKLLRDGPAVVEEFFKERPHRSKLYRLARKGRYGITLQTVTDGCLYSTRRWLIEFWCAVDVARRAVDAPQPATRPTRDAAATVEDDDVLARHGLGSGESGQ